MRVIALCLPALVAFSLPCTTADASQTAPDYARLYHSHNYFALRTALARDKTTHTEQVQFYRAAVMTAFNRSADADRIISALLKNNTDSSLRPKLLELRMTNAERQSDYAQALQAAQTLERVYAENGDRKKLDDVKNSIRLFGAIRHVPPQTVLRRGKSVIELSTNNGPGKCIPILFGKQRRCYILDSGANYSVLIRSEAAHLGLKVIPAGITVGSSTDATVTADLAVAPTLRIGNLEYHNVVFLVMPDSTFTFKDFTIRGILGYPVFTGMGAIRTYIGKRIDIPAHVPDVPVDNIALDDRDILTEVKAAGHSVLCRLDTGADRTVFYKSYFDRFRRDVEKQGTAHKVRTAGAGGIRNYRAYTLPRIVLEFAGHKVSLQKARVYTEKVVPQDYLMCNLGLDVLGKFSSYTINLKAMSLQLH